LSIDKETNKVQEAIITIRNGRNVREFYRKSLTAILSHNDGGRRTSGETKIWKFCSVCYVRWSFIESGIRPNDIDLSIVLTNKRESNSLSGIKKQVLPDTAEMRL